MSGMGGACHVARFGARFWDMYRGVPRTFRAGLVVVTLCDPPCARRCRNLRSYSSRRVRRTCFPAGVVAVAPPRPPVDCLGLEAPAHHLRQPTRPFPGQGLRGSPLLAASSMMWFAQVAPASSPLDERRGKETEPPTRRRRVRFFFRGPCYSSSSLVSGCPSSGPPVGGSAPAPPRAWGTRGGRILRFAAGRRPPRRPKKRMRSSHAALRYGTLRGPPQ